MTTKAITSHRYKDGKFTPKRTYKQGVKEKKADREAKAWLKVSRQRHT